LIARHHKHELARGAFRHDHVQPHKSSAGCMFYRYSSCDQIQYKAVVYFGPKICKKATGQRSNYRVADSGIPEDG
jgi:hypothetical protein